MLERIKSVRTAWVVGGIALILVLFCASFLIWVRITSQLALTRAQKLFSQREPAAARKSLERVLWFQPTHADALMLLGKCLHAEQDYDAAAEAFSRVPVDSPRHEEASMSEAFSYLYSLRFDAGEEALLRHLQRYPTGPEHPYSRAAQEELKWVYFNQLRRRDQERLLESSLARHPRDYALLVDLLNIEFRRQLAQEGIGHLKKVNEEQPGQPTILLALGYCNWKLGDIKTAWPQVQAAMEMRPEHLETRLVAAEILLEQGQLDSAEALLTCHDARSSLAERFQNDDRWWWLKSQLAELRGDEELALNYLEKAIALRPCELQYVHRRGVLLRGLGRTEEAAGALAAAKQLELCESRLNEILRSGALERPTADVCLEVADLCEKRGRKLQAEGWRYIAGQLQP